jgi:hypothetical protein
MHKRSHRFSHSCHCLIQPTIRLPIHPSISPLSLPSISFKIPSFPLPLSSFSSSLPLSHSLHLSLSFFRHTLYVSFVCDTVFLRLARVFDTMPGMDRYAAESRRLQSMSMPFLNEELMKGTPRFRGQDLRDPRLRRSTLDPKAIVFESRLGGGSDGFVWKVRFGDEGPFALKVVSDADHHGCDLLAHIASCVPNSTGTKCLHTSLVRTTQCRGSAKTPPSSR